MNRTYLTLAGLTGAAMAVLLACALSLTLWHALTAQLSTPSAWITPMCVWRHGNQVGLWWNNRVPVALARANASANLCFAVPWLPFLPFQGAPALTLPW